MSTDTVRNSTLPTKILVVEAEPSMRSQVVQFIGEALGWRTTEASDSATALESIKAEPPQIILTSLVLEGRPVFEFLEQLRQDVPQIPVVILMSPGSEPATLRALQHGAAGYTSTESFADELPEILERVFSAAQSIRDRKRLQSSVGRIDIQFLLENDPALVPVLVAEVQDYLAWMNFLDRPARVRLGVALEEAILNAIIHGNLEISSTIRQQDDGEYRRLIEERRNKDPYQNRRVRFGVRIRPGRAAFTVADRGSGFDPESLPDPTDPANLERVSGRGLLLIRTFMDEVSFNRKGNRVTMVKFSKSAASGIPPRRSKARKALE